ATSNGNSANISAAPVGAVDVAGTVTITTTAPHGFTVGQKVVISGVGVGGFNGEFTITAVPTASTFRYSTASGLAASGGGAATLATSSILTSPFLSLDGTKVAFVETITTSGPNDCGIGVAGPCFIFHVLTIGTTGSNGTFS